MGIIAQFATLARPFLEVPYIRRVRRNHGLEHATIHMLAQGKAGLRVGGRSDGGGFYLYGSVTTEEVTQAVNEALDRLRSGQHQLAVHPNCGTNLLTTGTLAALAAMLGLAGTEDDAEKRLERFPTILMLIIGTLIFGPGLGMAFQRHFTTSGEPGEMTITSIDHREVNAPTGAITMHRINTAHG